MMTSMTRKEFRLKYPYLVKGEFKSAIFEKKENLLKEIVATGYPVYQDTFYYGSPGDDDTFHLITEKDIPKVKEWRDCHYYSLCSNADNSEKAWIMTGGRYD